MLILGIDTATARVGVAVLEAEGSSPRRSAARTVTDPRRHAEALSPLVTAVLADVGATPDDLSAVAVGVGPGPYTGLRVGLVTAAALGHTLGIEVYGVCSLDAVLPSPESNCLVLTDARRREVYWARYAPGGRREDGPAVDSPAVVAAYAADNGISELLGAGARLYCEVLQGAALARGHRITISDPSYPDALAIARLAADRICAGVAPEPLRPLYLRRPDAAEPHAPKPVTAPGAGVGVSSAQGSAQRSTRGARGRSAVEPAESAQGSVHGSAQRSVQG